MANPAEFLSDEVGDGFAANDDTAVAGQNQITNPVPFEPQVHQGTEKVAVGKVFRKLFRHGPDEEKGDWEGLFVA